jgi:hypothetical protein
MSILNTMLLLLHPIRRAKFSFSNRDTFVAFLRLKHVLGKKKSSYGHHPENDGHLNHSHLMRKNVNFGSLIWQRLRHSSRITNGRRFGRHGFTIY